MSYYGYAVTNKGRYLLAKLLAGEVMMVTKVVFGSGMIPDRMTPREMTSLVSPVAQGIYSRPYASEGTAYMTVEFRSDLNGGLSEGFDLREFGIYAEDPDEGEVMIYYATLGDHPQWVGPYDPADEGNPGKTVGIDVRRFPITIEIGEDRGITSKYNTELWMTETDVYNYYRTVLLPIYGDDLIKKRIEEHNMDPEAHPEILKRLAALEGRIRILELQTSTDVTENAFLVTFETLDGKTVEGTWNEKMARIEF